MVVYEFLYNSNVWESNDAATISIHKTKKGAKKAMKKHKKKIKKKFEFDNEDYINYDESNYSSHEWDYNKWWGIRKTKVLDDKKYNKLVKDILQLMYIVVIVFTILYLIGSCIANNFNMKEWDSIGRFSIILLTVLGSLATFYIKMYNRSFPY